MKKMEITADDLRNASIAAGLDPDKYNYAPVERGFSIRKGIISVGTMVLEDDAKLIVAVFNTRERTDDIAYHHGTGDGIE